MAMCVGNQSDRRILFLCNIEHFLSYHVWCWQNQKSVSKWKRVYKKENLIWLKYLNFYFQVDFNSIIIYSYPGKIFKCICKWILANIFIEQNFSNIGRIWKIVVPQYFRKNSFVIFQHMVLNFWLRKHSWNIIWTRQFQSGA